MSKIVVRIMVALCCAWSAVSLAESVKVKAKGVYPSAGWRVSQDEREQTIRAAKVAALKKYGSQIESSSSYKLYQELLPTFEQNVDEYVLGFTVLAEGKNDATKAYEISIEASLDANRIAREIERHSPTQQVQASSGGDSSDMVFVFVGRKVAALTTSEGTRVEFSDIQKSGTEMESEKIGSAGVQVVYDSNSSETKKYGGSRIDQAQKIEWQATTISDVDAAVSEIFTKANYECIDARDVDGLDLDLFLADYSNGDDVSSSTRRATIQLLREYDVPLFATGRLDILLPDTHPGTGQSRAYVKVSAKVTSLQGKLPKTVAAIRGVQYQGVGDSPMVAVQNALNEASRKAAQDLVDQLRVKGIR